jgi:protein TonB
MLVPSVTGLLKTQVVVMKFAVHADGRIGQFRLLTTIQYPEIAHWLRRAVYSCEWEPGSDREGRPIALWVVLPVRF